MIRVSILSNDVMPQGVAGADIYTLEHPTWALESNQLKERRRCNLGGDGEPTLQHGDRQVGPGAGRPIGGAGQPHLAASASLPRRGVL